jgi:hypothetical protein
LKKKTSHHVEPTQWEERMSDGCKRPADTVHRDPVSRLGIDHVKGSIRVKRHKPRDVRTVESAKMGAIHNITVGVLQVIS